MLFVSSEGARHYKALSLSSLPDKALDWFHAPARFLLLSQRCGILELGLILGSGVKVRVWF